MFGKVLIANRGAIACRIIRTLRRMRVATVAIYSAADRHSLHVRAADEAVEIGPAAAAQSYLSVEALLDAAVRTGAEAIHPGYGFLSESAAFAEACAARGIMFIGPTPAHLRDFGLKHTARAIAAQGGVPLLPGTPLLASAEEAAEQARAIGYPVMLKSTAGGGGIGMRLCRDEAELLPAFEAVERLSHASFGTSGLYLEKFVENARHIEVQIFGDGAGQVVALGERDCSAQRRNQKVIEETPAPGLTQTARAALLDAALRLGRAVNYQSAGTVEFIYDNDTGAWYFLEVNTRLQVEHGVTEEVTGIDLVEWMVLQAAGEMGPLDTLSVRPQGCSLQVRLYAEDPAKEFQPSAGKLSLVAWPAGTRVETWVESGTEVTPYYDPMLAKIIVHGEDRASALVRMRAALAECRVYGIETNLEYLRQVTADAAFETGGITTSYLRGFDYRRRAVDVIVSGVQTTVQDYPGRLGYWHVGVPPSGPMDDRAFRAANQLVGNDEGAAGLEIAVMGPTLRIAFDTTIAITGADFGARLNSAPVARWQAVPVAAGSVLEMGAAQGAGSRAYFAIAGGIEVPEYLGSKSTFILGRFRRPRRTRPPRRRCAACRGGVGQDRPGGLSYGVHERVGNRRGVRPARSTRFLHARRHRNVLLHRLEGALQFRPHGRPPDRSQAGVGAQGRRRGRTAPFQHSRQCVRRGHSRFHRRHARHTRPRRSQPRRFRVPRHRPPRRVVEGRPTSTGRLGALPA